MFFVIVIPSLPDDDDELLLPCLSDIETMHHPAEVDHPVAPKLPLTLLGLLLNIAWLLFLPSLWRQIFFKCDLGIFVTYASPGQTFGSTPHCEFIERGSGIFLYPP